MADRKLPRRRVCLETSFNQLPQTSEILILYAIYRDADKE